MRGLTAITRSAPRSALGIAAILLTSLLSRAAFAHPVPGDADPGRDLYVLPGALVSPGIRPCCSTQHNGFIDVGLELSAHRFVPKPGTIFDQLGYGALLQLQVGGIPLERPAGELGSSLRVAIGAQGTWGLFGAQAGIMTRALSANYASAVGVFGGVFFSIALVSAGVQVDAPVFDVGEGPRMPLLMTFPVTLKWVVPIDMSPRRRE